jgi:regulator of protease activity HflC (stomatin/prohibitin superfamily)
MTAMLTLAITQGGCSRVPPGNVGILVNNLGSEKGVEATETGVGYVWVGPFRNLYLFPTFTQNYTWTKSPEEGRPTNESITFQTMEGMTVDADVGITYHIEKDKAAVLFATYRKGIDEITDIYMRNMVRDALVTNASSLTVDAIYGNGKAALIKSVEDHVAMQLAPRGIIVERVYWIGTVRLPEAVIAALNAKIQATQMAQQRENEVAQARAEAQKVVETAKGEAASRIARATGEAQAITVQAEAQAKANELLAKSLTPDLVKYRAIDKWTGAVPTYTGSGTVPFINLTGEK